jgi:hypothetical protein
LERGADYKLSDAINPNLDKYHCHHFVSRAMNRAILIDVEFSALNRR